MDRGRLVRQPGAEHRAEQPVATAVAGEHTTCAVGAVRRRSQAEYDDPGVRIAEPGHRPAPVALVAERRPLLRGDVLAPLDEPWAAVTRDHLGLETADPAQTIHACRR